MKIHRQGGKLRRDAGKIVRGAGGDCCCGGVCSDCITLFQSDSPSSHRKKSNYRGYPTSDYVFKDYKSVEDTWGAYAPPTLDGGGFPIPGTGNPPYDYFVTTYFNMQTCHRLLISPFITGALGDQTGTFTPEYVLKTNACGFKPFAPCFCFGEQKRPFASSYNSQTGTLLDTFPHWTGPATTDADCPALSATGAATIASVGSGDCPPGHDTTDGCCRVGGYETGSASVLPEWDWLQSRSWWNGYPVDGPQGPVPFADTRLILLVSYMTMSKWEVDTEGPGPDVRTWIESQPVSDSGARIVGAFLSQEP